MIRQQYRLQLREAIKTLAKAKKVKEFKLMNKYFAKLDSNKEDFLLLKDGKHPDPKKTVEYSRFIKDMKDFIALEQRVEYLKGLKTIPDTQTEQTVPKEVQPL